jgi:hypothetical protein
MYIVYFAIAIRTIFGLASGTTLNHNETMPGARRR